MQFRSHRPQLLVQVLQTLDEELQPVVPAQLCARRLSVEDEDWEQADVGAVLALESIESLSQAGVVVKAESVPEPENVELREGRGRVHV